MARRTVLLAVALLIVSSLAGAAALRTTVARRVVPKPIVESELRGFTKTSPLSTNDLFAINDYMAGAATLPSGITESTFYGRVSASLALVEVNGTAEPQVIVTVVDDSADIDRAELFDGAQLLFSATRATGSIVDRSGFGIATLTAFVPASRSAITVRWTSTANVAREESVTY